MARSGDEGLEQRLDRWVEAGRQFVDGVSGARPGSRGSARSGSRDGQRRGASRLSPGDLGRWVETKLEWLLDDEGDDDWREPWQAPRPRPRLGVNRSPRRPLEAISRRGTAATPQPVPRSEREAEGSGDWPSDDDLRIARWQRDLPPASLEASSAPPPAPQPSRPLPRSTRRR